MNIIIFGATGSVGRHLVDQACAQGHKVTAFTRNAAGLRQTHPNLRTVVGDVFDSEAVAAAVQGQTAVLCALGAGRKGAVRAAGTANIIKAMHRHGVKRFICQSTLGAGDSAVHLNFFWKHIMFGVLLRPAFADHARQEAMTMASDLDWTIVRPAAFTDGPETGQYKHGFSTAQKNLSLKISRADVARFMLSQLTNKQYLRKTPGLSY